MPAIPPHDTSTVERPWDAGAARRNAPNEASVLRYMSAYREAGADPDLKGSYKFPHHQPRMGAPANLDAVRNALARLAQDPDIPDAAKPGVERHLREHLEDGRE